MDKQSRIHTQTRIYIHYTHTQVIHDLETEKQVLKHTNTQNKQTNRKHRHIQVMHEYIVTNYLTHNAQTVTHTYAHTHIRTH